MNSIHQTMVLIHLAVAFLQHGRHTWAVNLQNNSSTIRFSHARYKHWKTLTSISKIMILIPNYSPWVNLHMISPAVAIPKSTSKAPSVLSLQEPRWGMFRLISFSTYRNMHSVKGPLIALQHCKSNLLSSCQNYTNWVSWLFMSMFYSFLFFSYQTRKCFLAFIWDV